MTGLVFIAGLVIGGCVGALAMAVVAAGAIADLEDSQPSTVIDLTDRRPRSAP